MSEVLTNEEKAKIFALYLGCLIISNDEIGQDHNEVELTGVNSFEASISFIDYTDNNRHYTDIDANSHKLLLKSLSDITDEDAAELSEAFFPDGNIYDYLHGAATGKAIVASIRNNRQTNTFYTHARIYDGFQFLISRAYAVPLYPYNKTAIQLGLAVDVKTLK